MSKTIFGCDYDAVIHRYTPQEALAKFEPYRKEQAEIKVGDVVESNMLNPAPNRLIVTKVYNETFEGVDSDGYVYAEKNFKFWKKTGKHIDIASILAEIGKE